MKYEHKIARGDCLDSLSKDITRIANIRDDEISKFIDEGYDVLTRSHEWFVPVGELSITKEGFITTYTQIMRRII